MRKLLFDKIAVCSLLIFSSCAILGGKDGMKRSAIRRPAPSIYATGWPAAHADGGNTDYSPVFGPKNITLAWEREFDGTINLGPTNDSNGQVYVTNNGEGCHLHALDSKTGQTRWCTDEVNRFAVASSALLDSDGRIFLADDEAMHAFDNSGTLLWETPIEGFPFSVQFTQTGRLIFITNVGRIYVLDRTSGEYIPEPVNLAPSIGYSGDTDVRACMRGTTIFTVDTTIGVNGTIYVPSFNGRLFAFKHEKLPN
jgi:outer membrane protein assembly factor BamB